MEQEILDKEIVQLESPFTWDLFHIDIKKITWNFKQKDKLFPEITFISYLMSAYFKIIKMQYDNVDEDFADAELAINDFKSPIKKEVAKHIFDATKAYSLKEKGNFEEFHKIMKNVKSLNEKDYLTHVAEFKATVYTLCNYSALTTEKAIKYLKVAVEDSPESATLHYLAGRNLRMARRLISVHNCPEVNEMYHFLRAYDLEKNPRFGIFAAQCLRESGQKFEAMEIFQELDSMNVEDISIQLRLALVFMHNPKNIDDYIIVDGDNDPDRCLDDAKKCLDYVEFTSPDNPVLLYYKGLYFMKRKDYEEAAKWLSIAGDNLNYNADISFIMCMKYLGKPFDYVSHFLKMKEKYSGSENARKKEILLNLAFCYFDTANLEESFKYFLLALETRVLNFSLENFHCQYLDKLVNVFDFVQKDLLPNMWAGLRNGNITISEEMILAIQKLDQITTCPL